MASATSSRRVGTDARNGRGARGRIVKARIEKARGEKARGEKVLPAARGIGEARTLEEPLRALAHERCVAPLLYFELTGLDGLDAADARRANALGADAVAKALLGAVGSLLRRNDVVVSGPGARWFAALLLDRAVAARARDAVSDADLGLVAGRLRGAIQTGLDAVADSGSGGPRVGVRAGWTIIEPRDGERPLSELRHALRGAAVVARIEERRATVVAAITHELRTPLTSILGYAEQLSGDGWSDARKRARALDVMADEARRLSRLVEGLIDTGAWQAGRLLLRRRRVDLRGLVDRAVRMIVTAIRPRALRFSVRGRAVANVDADRLLQVIANVLDNAVRHARGTVSVTVARRCIVVSDDGPGFDGVAPSALGTPFGVGANGRIGLGLAIARMLVEAHGGTIGFETARRGGARVVILLPP